MSIFSSTKARVVAGVGVAVSAVTQGISNMFAFTGDANGYPVMESADSAAILAAVKNAVFALLNYITSNWVIIGLLIGVSAILGFMYYIMHRAQNVVHAGR